MLRDRVTPGDTWVIATLEKGIEPLNPQWVDDGFALLLADPFSWQFAGRMPASPCPWLWKQR